MNPDTSLPSSPQGYPEVNRYASSSQSVQHGAYPGSAEPLIPPRRCPMLSCPHFPNATSGDMFSSIISNFVTSDAFDYWHRNIISETIQNPPPSPQIPSSQLEVPDHPSITYGGSLGHDGMEAVTPNIPVPSFNDWGGDSMFCVPSAVPLQAPATNHPTETNLLHIVPQGQCKVRGKNDWHGEGAFISFDMANKGDALLLRDALNGICGGLIGRDDKNMFSDQEGTAISLRIKWPGQREDWTHQMKTFGAKGKGPDPFKRAKVSTEVAKMIKRFIAETKDRRIDEGSREWRVGPSYITIDNLALVGLRRVSKASFQPVLALI